MAGQNVGQIFLQLSIQNNVASQISTQANQAASQAQSAFGGGASRIAAMSKKFLAGAAVTALVAFGKKAIDVASDLEEVQNVVDTAFGDMAYQCEEFAKTASKQFGISELQAKKMASTFMSMSKGMGLSGDEAARMSINIAKLSADVASFYNLSADEASTKLKAIWTGETEGLKDLGVVMTQANLEAYAMSNGIKKNIKDMNQAEQTTLRYNYVMEQLSLAQGDFAKTSGSWSNSVKSMGENFKTAMGNIGAVLIQVFTPVLQILSELIEKFAALTEKMKSTVNKIFGKETTDEAVKNITSGGKEMAEAVENTNKEVEKAALGLAGFDQLYTIGKKKKDDVSSSGNAVAEAMGEVQAYKSAEVEKESLLDRFGKKVVSVYKKIEPHLKGFYNSFVSPVVKAIKFCLEYIGTKIGPMKEIFGKIFKGAAEVAVSAFEWFSSIFGGVMQSLGGFWEQYGKPIFKGIIDACVDVWNIVQKVFNSLIVPLFKKIFSLGKNFWEKHGKPMFDSLLGLLGEVGKLLLSIWENVLKPGINWVIEACKPLVNGIMWLWDKLSAIAGFVADIFTRFIDQLKSSVKLITEVFDEGIIQSFKNLISAIGDLFSGLWELIKMPINWIIEGINKVISGLNHISVDVPDWVPIFGGQTWGFNIPEIPMLAKGGIVDQPTLNIAGEAGPEAITPISKLEEIVAKVVAQTIAAMKETNTEENPEITIPLTVNLGNKTVVKEVIKGINRQSKVNGKPVIINT